MSTTTRPTTIQLGGLTVTVPTYVPRTYMPKTGRPKVLYALVCELTVPGTGEVLETFLSDLAGKRWCTAAGQDAYWRHTSVGWDKRAGRRTPTVGGVSGKRLVNTYNAAEECGANGAGYGFFDYDPDQTDVVTAYRKHTVVTIRDAALIASLLS